MSYRSSLVLIPALSFVLSVSAIADITLNNGADINMTGSPVLVQRLSVPSFWTDNSINQGNLCYP